MDAPIISAATRILDMPKASQDYVVYVERSGDGRTIKYEGTSAINSGLFLDMTSPANFFTDRHSYRIYAIEDTATSTDDRVTVADPEDATVTGTCMVFEIVEACDVA